MNRKKKKKKPFELTSSQKGPGKRLTLFLVYDKNCSHFISFRTITLLCLGLRDWSNLTISLTHLTPMFHFYTL